MQVLLVHHNRLGEPERLVSAQRDLVVNHLIALEPEARRLRFGTPCADAVIAAYVAGIDFDRDVVLGWYDDNRVLGGVVHLARIDDGEVEFSISVLARYRGRGLGQRMTNEAFTEAARHGFGRAHVQFVADNRQMAAILGHYRARLERSASEHTAAVPLPAELVRPLTLPIGPFVGLAFA